ncbi:hypothetical protein [Oceanicola sp. S124]|uniref:hypothetical protein n=1 Tax=Oceanicola sp. S124 TaxID=1042378 RepID=UPI00049495B1|nr:hypothetical protein [Oceanicola sp. S124]
MQDRSPLETYDQALWRLVQYVVSERYSRPELTLAIQLVADIYWVSEAKVVSDMNKRSSGLGVHYSKAEKRPRQRVQA